MAARPQAGPFLRRGGAYEVLRIGRRVRPAHLAHPACAPPASRAHIILTVNVRRPLGKHTPPAEKNEDAAKRYFPPVAIRMRSESKSMPNSDPPALPKLCW